MWIGITNTSNQSEWGCSPGGVENRPARCLDDTASETEWLRTGQNTVPKMMLNGWGLSQAEIWNERSELPYGPASVSYFQCGLTTQWHLLQAEVTDRCRAPWTMWHDDQDEILKVVELRVIATVKSSYYLMLKGTLLHILIQTSVACKKLKGLLVCSWVGKLMPLLLRL